MKAVLRIVRALFVRILFMAYSLLCVWRTTFVSDNKFYWLMMISLGFLLIETGVILWLRAGNEFNGVLPSVVFFLSCVVPSLWILSLNEADRKNRFHSAALADEMQLKEFIRTLTIWVAPQPSSATGGSEMEHVARNIVASRSTQLYTSAASLLAAAATFKIARHADTRLVGNPNDNAVNTDKSKINAPLSVILSTVSTPQSSWSSTAFVATAASVECCDVKVSYKFHEDNWQRLFFQLLMLILTVSRWMVARGELSLNQRSLILVISIATASDTIDFCSYMDMPLVYRHSYMMFSALVILTLSLVQFVFLHVDDSLTMLAAAAAAQSPPSRSKHLFDENNTTAATAAATAVRTAAQYRHKPFVPNGTLVNLIGSHERLARLARNGGEITTAATTGCVAGATRMQSRATRSCVMHYLFHMFCCCCVRQQATVRQPPDPIFFILLSGLCLHDALYLTFRVFVLSKIGLSALLADNPALFFFMCKNILIIAAQMHKVYTVARRQRQMQLLDNYRQLVLGSGSGINGAGSCAHQPTADFSSGSGSGGSGSGSGSSCDHLYSNNFANHVSSYMKQQQHSFPSATSHGAALTAAAAAAAALNSGRTTPLLRTNSMYNQQQLLQQQRHPIHQKPPPPLLPFNYRQHSTPSHFQSQQRVLAFVPDQQQPNHNQQHQYPHLQHSRAFQQFPSQQVYPQSAVSNAYRFAKLYADTSRPTTPGKNISRSSPIVGSGHAAPITILRGGQVVSSD